MLIPAEALSGTSVRDKVVTAEEAVRLVRDGDSVVVEGFVGQCFAEELTLALEERYLRTSTPKDLGLVFTVAAGDRKGRGLDRLAHEGLLKKAVGGHWGLSPALGTMAVGNQIAAHNLPQGVVSQLFRDTAAGKPGLVTRVGLGTFVDPRNGGGKINDATREDLVELITLDGAEYLFYKAFKLDVAFLRGTTADPEGNITMEREALTMEALAVATAVHNCGGLVIVQVERVAESGSLSGRDVKIPGVLVDCVVVSEPEHHWQTWGSPYSPAFSGELRRVRIAVPALELNERKVIARRAAMELRPDSVVNLGIGIPEGVANVASEERILDYLTLTAEPGPMGGMPAGGLDFGSAVNAHAILDQPSQFDFYDGGGLDVAFLGMAQADRVGNVNVSRFGTKLAGSGGFINISQNAKRLVFMGSFVVPSRCRVQEGRLVIGDGLVAPKFLADVEQRTFSGEYAAQTGQPVLYVTERCVFRLTPEGLRAPRDRSVARPREGHPVPHRVRAHHERGAKADGLEDLRRRSDGPSGRPADHATGRTVRLRHRAEHVLPQHGGHVPGDEGRGRSDRLRGRPEAGRHRQEGADGRQLRQLLPGPGPDRRVRRRRPRADRTLLRQCHPVHDECLHAAQAQ